MVSRNFIIPRIVHHGIYYTIRNFKTISRLSPNSQILQSTGGYSIQKWYNNSSSNKCWKCETSRASSNGFDQFFCNHCGSITEIKSDKIVRD